MKKRNGLSEAIVFSVIAALCGCGCDQKVGNKEGIETTTTTTTITTTTTTTTTMSSSEYNSFEEIDDVEVGVMAQAKVYEKATITTSEVSLPETTIYVETKLPEGTVNTVAPLVVIPTLTEPQTETKAKTSRKTIDLEKSATTKKFIDTTSMNMTKQTTTTSTATTQPTAVTTTTASNPTTTTTTTTPVVSSSEEWMKELPSSIQQSVEYWKGIYPNMELAMGIYSLDGKRGYEYGASTKINGACSIKSSYACYVFKICDETNIDIERTFLTYEERHDDPGSSWIQQNGYHGQKYSVRELVRLLLTVSDNVAFKMLAERWSISDFYSYNISIGGESDWQKWGKVTPRQRMFEWKAIWEYINSGSQYSTILEQYLLNNMYSYFRQGMCNAWQVLDKSGWTDDNYIYPSATDAGIINGQYILVILTEDYTAGTGHVDCIQSLAGSVENFMEYEGGLNNLS